MESHSSISERVCKSCSWRTARLIPAIQFESSNHAIGSSRGRASGGPPSRTFAQNAELVTVKYAMGITTVDRGRIFSGMPGSEGEKSPYNSQLRLCYDNTDEKARTSCHSVSLYLELIVNFGCIHECSCMLERSMAVIVVTVMLDSAYFESQSINLPH